MVYLEIIRQGVRVGNRNLAVLLTQFMAGLAIGFVLLVILFVFALMAQLSLPDIVVKDLSLDSIQTLFNMSVSLLAAGALFGAAFLVVVMVITAFINSGNLSCVLSTARGVSHGFRADEFRNAGNRHVFNMLGLMLVWGAIALGMTVVLGVFADAGLYRILLPMKEGGHRLAAFTFYVPFMATIALVNLFANYAFVAGWSFSSIILVDEGSGVPSALRGAYRFIKANFWDSFLFIFLLLAMIFAVFILANLLAVIVLLPLNISRDTSEAVVLGSLPIGLMNLLLIMYMGLVATSSFAVYYVAHATPPTAENSTPAPSPS